MDYAGNAKKDKEPKEKVQKELKKVVSDEVVIKKKTLGQKFKGLFVEADLRSIVRYIGSDVLLPAARNMIVDATRTGIERMMYGDSAVRRQQYGSASRYSYNAPVNRGYRELSQRSAPPLSERRLPPARYSGDTIIISSREEAELVLEMMNNVIESYEVATAADLNELVGLPTSHVDHKWGWISLVDAHVRQVREGYLLDLPPAEPIQ